MKLWAGVLLLGSLSLCAQERPVIPSVGVFAEYNNLLLHSQDIAPIGPSNPIGIGIDVYAQLLGTDHWRNCHCVPAFGVSLNYHDLDKPGILDYAVPVYAFLEPRFEFGGGWIFSFRGGAGFTWLSTPFDSVTNPLNLSYSRHLNSFVMVNAGLRKRVSDHWSLHLAVQYNHASNGGVQVPNKGLNYYGLRAGVDYSFYSSEPPRRPRVPKEELIMKRRWDLIWFGAAKRPPGSEASYLITGLIGQYSRQFGRTSAWMAGAELVWHGTNAHLIRQEELSLHPAQVNVLAGHEFLLGRFTFSQQAGVYLWRDYNSTPDWYQRYSIGYRVWRSLALGTSLKVHGHVAEWLEGRIALVL